MHIEAESFVAAAPVPRGKVSVRDFIDRLWDAFPDDIRQGELSNDKTHGPLKYTKKLVLLRSLQGQLDGFQLADESLLDDRTQAKVIAAFASNLTRFRRTGLLLTALRRERSRRGLINKDDNRLFTASWKQSLTMHDDDDPDPIAAWVLTEMYPTQHSALDELKSHFERPGTAEEIALRLREVAAAVAPDAGNVKRYLDRLQDFLDRCRRSPSHESGGFDEIFLAERAWEKALAIDASSTWFATADMSEFGLSASPRPGLPEAGTTRSEDDVRWLDRSVYQRARSATVGREKTGDLPDVESLVERTIQNAGSPGGLEDGRWRSVLALGAILGFISSESRAENRRHAAVEPKGAVKLMREKVADVRESARKGSTTRDGDSGVTGLEDPRFYAVHKKLDNPLPELLPPLWRDLHNSSVLNGAEAPSAHNAWYRVFGAISKFKLNMLSEVARALTQGPIVDPTARSSTASTEPSYTMHDDEDRYLDMILGDLGSEIGPEKTRAFVLRCLTADARQPDSEECGIWLDRRRETLGANTHLEASPVASFEAFLDYVDLNVIRPPESPDDDPASNAESTDLDDAADQDG